MLWCFELVCKVKLFSGNAAVFTASAYVGSLRSSMLGPRVAPGRDATGKTRLQKLAATRGLGEAVGGANGKAASAQINRQREERRVHMENMKLVERLEKVLLLFFCFFLSVVDGCSWLVTSSVKM